MLPRRLRLSRRGFPAARAGKRAESQHFSLSYGPAKEGGAAAVVAKTVARRSVDRHLLKRRMLEVLRPHARTDASLIAYARAGAPALPFLVLKGELEALISRTIHP